MTSLPPAYLSLQSNRGTSRLPLVDAQTWQIGRGRENAIPLFDHCASRHHAQIMLVGGCKYYILDLGSRNGTYVNGRRISTPLLLKPHDRISIGETIMEFSAEPPQRNDLSTEATEIRLQKRRLITVLVVDIRNYSKLAQQTNERLMSEVMARWFTKTIAIMEKYSSHVDELIGDAFIALWIHNADADIQQVAINEILTAFRTLQDLHTLSMELNSQFQLSLPLYIGAGINTGYALVDEEQAGTYPSFQVIADAITKAIALEIACRELALDIAIAETTHRRTPYANVLLPFKQYFVNLANTSEPTLTYAGTFEAISQFLEKVSFVFAE
jgi:adenylate cyclase